MAALRRPTGSVAPGTPLGLDWGSASCVGEAIVVGSRHAIVLVSRAPAAGTVLQLENKLTGVAAAFSVVWCGEPDGAGRRKIGLQAVEDDSSSADSDSSGA